MRAIYFYAIILFSFKIYACTCFTSNTTLEFYESEYVFKGFVGSKKYAKDFLTYEVTFKILEHFKENVSNPKKISFKLKSESVYTGTWTSCDWSVHKDQTWLVFAKKDDSGNLTFSGICSNSRLLDKRPLSDWDKETLKKANQFKLENYIYSNELNFSFTETIINLDSIIKVENVKDYKKSFAWLKLLIDSEGNLIDIIHPNNLKQIKDKTNGLTREVENTNKTALSEFEKDAIRLLSEIKKWRIKKHIKTNTPVSYIQHISIEFDKKSHSWHFEF